MSILKSCVNALLKPAEDPRQSAAYTDERQRAMLVKVRGLLAEIQQTRQQLTKKTAVLATNMNRLEQQARSDLLNGREDIAKKRIQRQQMIIMEQQMIQTQISELDLEEQRLLLAEHRLVTHIEAYVARKEALQARYNSAESQVRLNKGLQKLFRDLADLEQIIELAETQTDQMEAHASLLDDGLQNDLLLNPTTNQNPWAETRNPLDLDRLVDAELQRLKSQLE